MADRLKYKRRIVSNEIIKEQRRRKNFRRKIFYILLTIIACTVFISLAFLVLMKVRDIRIEGNNRYSEEQIIEALSVDIGDNMYQFSAVDVENTVKTKLPYISQIEVKRVLPSTIELSVEEKPASMYISVNGEDFLLSEDLFVLERTTNPAKTEGLPQVVSSSVKRCIVGSYLVFSDDFTFDVLKSVWKSVNANFTNGEITQVDLSTRFDIWLMYGDRFSVYLGSSDDCDMKIRFLEKIIEQLDEDKTGRIDVSNVAKGAFKEGEPIKTY